MAIHVLLGNLHSLSVVFGLKLLTSCNLAELVD